MLAFEKQNLKEKKMETSVQIPKFNLLTSPSVVGSLTPSTQSQYVALWIIVGITMRRLVNCYDHQQALPWYHNREKAIYTFLPMKDNLIVPIKKKGDNLVPAMALLLTNFPLLHFLWYYGYENCRIGHNCQRLYVNYEHCLEPIRSCNRIQAIIYLFIYLVTTHKSRQLIHVIQSNTQQHVRSANKKFKKRMNFF